MTATEEMLTPDIAPNSVDDPIADAPSPPGTRLKQRYAAPNKSLPSPLTTSTSPSRMYSGAATSA